MNESLHESELFLKMLADFMPGMVGYWTRELRSVFAKGDYFNWYGKSKAEMEGISIRALLGDDLFCKHEPYIYAALAGESQTFDLTLTLSNHETKETIVHYIPHHDGSEVQGLFVLILDITERKSLERALVSAAEERQRWVGQELHDNLGQQIAAIAYQAQVLEHKIASSEGVEAAEIAASLAVQAQNAVMQCKHLARGLLPLELETGSLRDALQIFASSIALNYKISCSFACTGEITQGEDNLALNLYRIVQEAVHNAIDHGGAQHLAISLEAVDGMLRLSICDDGCGLAGSGANHEAVPGMGIKIMQYRANQIGATLKLVSRPSGGTEVLLER